MLRGPVLCTGRLSERSASPFGICPYRQQLEAIEARRGEGDLILKVGLRASTYTDETLPVQTLSDEPLTVPREEWLKALENSGYRKTLLFEVPVKHMDDHADALFKKAQYMIDTGLYKDAVMQCRHIIEHVEAERGDLEASKNANNASKTSKTRKEMSVEERMFSLREQVKSICRFTGNFTFVYIIFYLQCCEFNAFFCSSKRI